MRWPRLPPRSRGPRVTDSTLVAPAWGVLTSKQDALTILLSLRTDRLYTLDETGSVLWTLIGTGNTVGAVSAAANARFEALDDLPSHVHSFIADLVDKGVLAVSDARGRRPSTLSVLLCLTAIAVGLKVVGMERVWRLSHGSTRDTSRVTDPSYIEAITQAVTFAATMCPWRARCLHQSLATLFFLRRAGVDAHMRLGVQQYPFYAHAWVEVNGAPVNDNVEILKLYRPLAFFDIGCA